MGLGELEVVRSCDGVCEADWVKLGVCVWELVRVCDELEELERLLLGVRVDVCEAVRCCD